MEEYIQKVYGEIVVYVFSENEECVPFIREFQELLEKNNLWSQVVLKSEIYKFALGINNCYPCSEFINWTDMCLSRAKVLAILFKKRPNYDIHELFDLIKSVTNYKDTYLEFFEY